MPIRHSDSIASPALLTRSLPPSLHARAASSFFLPSSLASPTLSLPPPCPASKTQTQQPYLSHGPSSLECRARGAGREEIERQGGRGQEEGKTGGKEEEGELAAAAAAGDDHGFVWALLLEDGACVQGGWGV